MELGCNASKLPRCHLTETSCDKQGSQDNRSWQMQDLCKYSCHSPMVHGVVLEDG